MKKLKRRKNVWNVVFFICAVFAGTGIYNLSYGQMEQSLPLDSTVIRVAVIPLCLSTIDEARNEITIKAAEKLTRTLTREKAFQLITQEQVIDSFEKAKFSYRDVNGKNLDELNKVLPPHDVVVFVGPHPGKNAWYSVSVARSSDLRGKSTSLLLGDEDSVDLDKLEIAQLIREAMDAPQKP